MNRLLAVAILFFGVAACGGGGSNPTPAPPPPPPPPVVLCSASAQWEAPTQYEDCDPDTNTYNRYCGTPLPDGYITRFNLFMYDSQEEGTVPVLEIEVPDPNIVLWEVLGLADGTWYFNMTASGYEPGKEPDPDTGKVVELTSKLSNWKEVTCPKP